MTAMSATSAQQTPSAANPLRDLVASLRTVTLPGSLETYANRAYLREIGLRWVPREHYWHGTVAAGHVQTMREQLGLEVRCFGTLDPPPHGPSPPKSAIPSPRFGDYSRTRFESRVAFGGPNEGEDAEGVGTPARQFSLLDITSGLPDDSREADQRAAEQRLRDLRGRVKAARAVVAATPGLSGILAREREKAAQFYARLGITETMFRFGVEAGDIPDRYPSETVWQPKYSVAGVKRHSRALFPSAETGVKVSTPVAPLLRGAGVHAGNGGFFTEPPRRGPRVCFDWLLVAFVIVRNELVGAVVRVARFFGFVCVAVLIIRD